eukprot:TRINITY_DN15485_c0_g1_i1.p1 TRINITY_DN15485_c0_g1~~TRINITY_DN15485_c0_g1_i1.p1  ORF type:complete len:324 (+),score=65.06 TRINITY_DN15485_c0_g1_i1:122-1093(+)
MGGRKRAAATEATETMVEEDSDSDIDIDDEGVEDVGEVIHEGDEQQIVDFDVNVMEAEDSDGVFHSLQKWIPPEWMINMDDFVQPMLTSPITSIIKIPQYDEPGVDLGNDKSDVYGTLAIVSLQEGSSQGMQTLLQKLRSSATTEEVQKRDLSTVLSPESLKSHPVALIINERVVNIPSEVGAQLHVNMFEELVDFEKNNPGHPKFEFFLIMSKVRMNADKEVEKIEALERMKNKQRAMAESSKRTNTGDATLAINEENTLFTRAEEIFYFRNRVPDVAVKRWVLDPETSNDVVVMPLLVHRSSLPKLVSGIKTLDDYFLTAN